MPWLFRILNNETLPIDGRWCDPSRLASLSVSDVEHLPVLWGNRTVPLAELWSVQRKEGAENHVVLEGDHRAVGDLAHGMTSGTVRIQGAVGHGCGSAMSAGDLIIEGGAGDDLGLAMAGGRIEVRGNAGDGAGGHIIGARRGMTGGEILIHGSTGDFTGARMRRGTIAVNGSTGAATGHSMIAGSILVRETMGSLPGVGMKRGTIAQLGRGTQPVEGVFSLAWESSPRFLLPYFQRLPQSWNWPRELVARNWTCWRGDLLEGGLGELWIAGVM